MRRVTRVAAFAMFAFPVTGQVHAQSLRATPVTIDVPVSASSTIITVGNDSPNPMTVQARIFRWTQKDGRDVLEKTSDAIVSPPVLKVSKGADGVVRIARVSSAPVNGEETYRILLDEVPSREKLQGGGVTLVMRQSLPVFFKGLDLKPSSVAWTATRHGNKLVLRASNAGQKHLKIIHLQVTGENSKEIGKIDGLVGYVLGGQTKTWEFPLSQGQLAAGAAVTVSATSDTGQVNASAIAVKNG